MSKRIKIGVFSVYRGMIMVNVMSRHPDAELVAICDFDRTALKAAQQAVRRAGGRIRTYTDFDRFMDDDMDAVVLANYATEHAPYAVRLLDSGRHGGSDFYTMHFFLESILGRPGKKHAIDVYRALDMTLPGTLGFRSIMQANAPMEVPDLRKKSLRDKHRNDRWCPDPKMAGPGQPKASCSWEDVNIPESLYRRAAEKYRKTRGHE